MVTVIGELRSAPDASPAGWVAAGMQGFAESVLSVVPDGFGAYARIFHPATREQDGRTVPVPWHEVAAGNGRVAHRGMQWPHLTGKYHAGGQPGLWDGDPEEGILPAALAPVLAAVLGGHTATRTWRRRWSLPPTASPGPATT